MIFGTYKLHKVTNEIKKEHIAVNGYIRLTATGRHLPYGVTQCYLPPETSERVPP